MSTLQLRLATTAQGGGDNENPPRILATHLYSLKDQATRAEIIWTMNSAIHNYSAASCDNIKSVLNAMFPGAIPSDFSLARNKLSYLITEALGSYFYNQVIEYVKDSFYSIEYDETTNAENQKELQLMIRYWSESKEKINVKHLETMFIGHAKGEDLAQNILKDLENAHLSLQKMITLGSDGPNVNKKVFRLINEEVLSVRNKGLINIGTCNLHIVHNAFLKGLTEFGQVW